MKYFNGGIFAVIALFITVGFMTPTAVRAATAPSLGDAESFSVLGALSTAANGTGTTTSGDLGLSPGLAASRTGVWTVGGAEYFGTGGLSETAQTDALAAFNNLAAQTSDGLWASASPVPGVYTIAADTTFAGPTLTLNGGYNDVWVFQIGNDMTFTGDVVMTGNAQACNVFWQIGRDATIGAGSNFAGTLIASRDITVASGASVDGRVISLNSSIVFATGNAVSGPTCNVAPTPSPSPTPSSPSGGHTPSFIPLISLVKVPTPLALPDGPASVTYDYAVKNPSIQALSDVTLTDDMCEPLVRLSGDENGDNLLDPSETWHYRCTMTLAATTTNTAVATGYGDGGESAIATAIATVVVGSPLPPPLINVVKVPSRLAPFPYGGGAVMYTYTVTNPGIVPMHDVAVTDDKCGPVRFISGDSNDDNLLDPGETWTYGCQMNVVVSTRNIATARGEANGFTALGYAFATVLVAGPGLPNTGIPLSPWNIIALVAVLVVALVAIILLRKSKKVVV